MFVFALCLSCHIEGGVCLSVVVGVSFVPDVFRLVSLWVCLCFVFVFVGLRGL